MQGRISKQKWFTGGCSNYFLGTLVLNPHNCTTAFSGTPTNWFFWIPNIFNFFIYSFKIGNFNHQFFLPTQFFCREINQPVHSISKECAPAAIQIVYTENPLLEPFSETWACVFTKNGLENSLTSLRRPPSGQERNKWHTIAHWTFVFCWILRLIDYGFPSCTSQLIWLPWKLISNAEISMEKDRTQHLLNEISSRERIIAIPFQSSSDFSYFH